MVKGRKRSDAPRYTVQVRVGEQERTAFERTALDRGLTLAEWARIALRSAAGMWIGGTTMTDATKTLDTIRMALDDVRRMQPESAEAKSALSDALSHLYMADEAIERAMAADRTPSIPHPATKLHQTY